MTQSSLAVKSGMLQPRLSVMEDANYSSWSVSTLRRLAKAFDLALSVKFESFSEVISDFEELSRESLARPSFKDDPMFRSAKVRTHRAFRRRHNSDSERNAIQGPQYTLPFQGEIKAWPDQSSIHNPGEMDASGSQTMYLPERQGESLHATSVSAAG